MEHRTQPLAGRRIVITRARTQASALCARLEALGATVLEFPTIEICPPLDYAPLDDALRNLGAYDWLIFTSVNGVESYLRRARQLGVDPRPPRARICAIGPATQRAAEAVPLRVDVVPQTYVAEGLVGALGAEDLAGKRILLPRAAVARDLVPRELADLGARVDVVEAYRTLVPADASERARAAFSGPQPPDWITFTSSSTVTNFVKAAGTECLAGVRVASIGPVTSRTARRVGLRVDVEAAVYTIDGLVDAIAAAELAVRR